MVLFKITSQSYYNIYSTYYPAKSFFETSSNERGDGARWNILCNTYSLLGGLFTKKRVDIHTTRYISASNGLIRLNKSSCMYLFFFFVNNPPNGLSLLLQNTRSILLPYRNPQYQALSPLFLDIPLLNQNNSVPLIIINKTCVTLEWEVVVLRQSTL